jgi:predicted  nucleic acid-binding Zn-ribbon protein
MEFLALLIPILALSIPIVAIVNRKGSPIGQAIARRLDRGSSTLTRVADEQENAYLKQRVAQLEDKVQTLEIEMAFLNNLIEAPKEGADYR